MPAISEFCKATWKSGPKPSPEETARIFTSSSKEADELSISDQVPRKKRRSFENAGRRGFSIPGTESGSMGITNFRENVATDCQRLVNSFKGIREKILASRAREKY